MISVQEVYTRYKEKLKLTLVTGSEGLSNSISVAEVQRPGLSLTGYLSGYEKKRVLLFGRAEHRYVQELDPQVRTERLKEILQEGVPAVFLGRDLKPANELALLCDELKIPLFQTSLKTMGFLNVLTVLLVEEFSERLSVHGTLVEAFGIGVLIQGDSSIGKSEAALGLIERGHRLISDDVVKIQRKEGGYLEGTGPELTRHLIEIRGIGIINVAHLYGAVCISEKARVDMIIRLEEWNKDHFYDRVGLEEKFEEMIDTQVPMYLLPVKPGRDIVLLLETTVLNHRLKKLGFNSAKEFNAKLLEAIAKAQDNAQESVNSVQKISK